MNKSNKGIVPVVIVIIIAVVVLLGSELVYYYTKNKQPIVTTRQNQQQPKMQDQTHQVPTNTKDPTTTNTNLGVCGPCGDVCINNSEGASCPGPDGTFTCQRINGACTKLPS
jgi:hypothetical protein